MENLDLPVPPARPPVLAILCVAMPEEASAILDLAHRSGKLRRLSPVASLQLWQVEDAVLALLSTGVGLANAASALATALTLVSPRYIFSCGSAGGLDADSAVGDITAATDCLYSTADARLFDYAIGQIPGMPEFFSADPDLLSRFNALPPRLGSHRIRAGRFVSADQFVGSERAIELRNTFATAITTDMESAALAQVSWGAEVPFLAVRGISDLCGPEAAAENYQRAGDASRLSFLTVLCLLGLRETAELAELL